MFNPKDFVVCRYPVGTDLNRETVYTVHSIRTFDNMDMIQLQGSTDWYRADRFQANTPNAPQATLRGWRYDTDHNVVVGRIYNDTKLRFLDGEVVTTSAVKEIRAGFLRTRNTIYKLED